MHTDLVDLAVALKLVEVGSGTAKISELSVLSLKWSSLRHVTTC